MFIPFRSKREHRPVLVVIDSFSKRGDCRILKDKTPQSVCSAFQSIIESSKYLARGTVQVMKHPARLRTDRGSEFKGSLFRELMEKYDIHHFYALNPDVKAAIVERWIRTLKTRMQKFLFHRNIAFFKSYQQAQEVLDQLVHSYNSREHSSIGIAPISVNLSTQSLVVERRRRRRRKKQQQSSTREYQIGDVVRITSFKNVFTKGYKLNYSRTKFKIIRKSKTLPRMYTLVDADGEIIEGSFYEQELIPYHGK